MQRIAILGGGIAGLAAAYELEKHRRAGKPVDWHLFEASNRFGGTISTTRLQTRDGEYILEDGPDGWVTEKPWARDLAEELGLADQVIACNEAARRTYIRLHDQLVPTPDRMRLMVPEDLSALDDSSLFSEAAKHAYAAELTRAEELRGSVPDHDESVASFVRRHFGEEVLSKVAGPLLAGVFGGDVETLSVRAVMPAFVEMQNEFGSLIAALQSRTRTRGPKSPQPTFTSLRHGMGSLTEALLAHLPADRLHPSTCATALGRSPRGQWLVRFAGAAANSCAIGFVPYDGLLIATPIDVARHLLTPIDSAAAALIPSQASSAILATLCWPAKLARTFTIPPGFGFLVPELAGTQPQLLAATFADQKYPNRAPAGSRILRAFFGSHSAAHLAGLPDVEVASHALADLRSILGHLPDPDPALTTVRRWPRSLPQYEVGHLDRMAELQERIQALGNLALLGNGYRGVGVPDLIRDARVAARTLTQDDPLN